MGFERPGHSTDYVEAAPDLDAFHCTYSACGTFAQQIEVDVGFGASMAGPQWRARQCQRCFQAAVWVQLDDPDRWMLAYPPNRLGTPPHSDMPPKVLAVYEEARAVAKSSPRSAAGLLRLALQMLVDELDPSRGNLDAKIGKLTSRGLDERVQRAMDVLRVIGNNAVHPGRIDLDEEEDIVPSLFGLLNVVVEQVISRPKQIDALYAGLAGEALQGIAQREARIKSVRT